MAALSLFLAISAVDVGRMVPLAICQAMAAATLFAQWRTGAPWFFIARAIPSFARCVLNVRAAHCGRGLLWEGCDSRGWRDERLVFRVFFGVNAIRMFLEGVSLVLQYTQPGRGVTVAHGHEQLFYRGCMRSFGAPLHLTRGVLKLCLLTGTDFVRKPEEIVVNFIRCPLVAISAWSLWTQWRHTGTGNTEPAPREGRERQVSSVQVKPCYEIPNVDSNDT